MDIENDLQEERTPAPEEAFLGDPIEEGESMDAGSGEGSMEGLLEAAAQLQERLKAREVVWVKVIQTQKDQVQADIGEKHEAVIPLSEFTAPPAAGTRVPIVLVTPSRGEQPAVLSYKKARWQLGWAQVQKAHQEKARVRGIVTQSIKGGFLVDLGGVPGFLPASLADLRPVRKPETLVRSGVRCYIIEIDEGRKQVVLSRKAVLEEEAKKRKDKMLSTLKVGEVRIGRVAHVSAAGAFVNLGGVDGFIQTSDVAWKEPEKARQALQSGAKVRVKVLRVETESGKVALGLKQLTPNPADAIKRKYPVKTVVKGKVKEVTPEGVKLELSDGAAAFCAADDLPLTEEGQRLLDERRERERGLDRRPAPRQDPKKDALPVVWPKAGDAVSAIVVGVHFASFEVGVSIRRYEEIQDRKRVAQYLKGAPPLTLGQLLTPEGEG